jgi:ribosome-associated toxin RatA of RatAB toxin-antitoxin module
MESLPRRKSACRLAGWALLAACSGARAADFELTPAEAGRVDQGLVVIRAALDESQQRGEVRAALFIDAPPARVFQVMTRCADAMSYVPHLRSCRVLLPAAEANVRFVEHEVDFGWYAPRLRYVFRADLVENRRISFHQVDGDFRAHEGVWEFEPAGAGTLLRYRVVIDPPSWVPAWLARRSLKSSLPEMLTGLREHCETPARLLARANNLSLPNPHID